MRKLILLSLLCLPLLAFGKFKSVQVGDMAPEFSFNITDSTKAKFSDYKGKVIIVNFFATWCPPCKRELPFIESQIWEKYKDNPNFALMVFGRGHRQVELDKYRSMYMIDFPLYPDFNKNIYYLYAYDVIPRSYVIDKTGKVVYVSVGFNDIDFKKMVEVIDALMKE